MGELTKEQMDALVTSDDPSGVVTSWEGTAEGGVRPFRLQLSPEQQMEHERGLEQLKRLQILQGLRRSYRMHPSLEGPLTLGELSPEERARIAAEQGITPGESFVSHAGHQASVGLLPQLTGLATATARGLGAKPPLGEGGFGSAYREARDKTRDRLELEAGLEPVPSAAGAALGAGLQGMAAMRVPFLARHPALTSMLEGGIYGAGASPGDLTRGDVGTVGAHALGSGLMAGGTYGLGSMMGRGLSALSGRAGTRAAEASDLLDMMAARQVGKLQDRAGQSFGGEVSSVSKLMDDVSRLARDQDIDAPVQNILRRIEATPEFIANKNRHAARVATDYQRRISKEQIAEQAYRDLVKNQGPLASQARQALGDPRIKPWLWEKTKAYAEPTLGAIGGGIAGHAIGDYLQETTGWDIPDLVPEATGAVGGGNIFAKTRMMRAVGNKWKSPAVQQAVFQALSSYLQVNPQALGRLGTIASRALQGDGLALASGDLILSQTNPEYRAVKQKALLQLKLQNPAERAPFGPAQETTP